jgi:hypothetical protein
LNGTVLEEFIRAAMRQTLFASVEALRTEFDVWLHHYSHGPSHLGSRNQGRRPWETVKQIVTQGG